MPSTRAELPSRPGARPPATAPDDPLLPFASKGAIWYQGESNAGRAYAYRDLFPLMIQSWRDEWQQGDFPFYWVQLADFQAEKPQPAVPIRKSVTPDFLISIGSKPDGNLNQTLEIALRDMLRWLIEEKGMKPAEAHLLMGPPRRSIW